MQKKGISVLLSFCVLFIYAGSINAINEGGENATSRNEQIESDRLPIADPYVMLYNNKYYAYGTGGTTAGEGFACFSSDDLKNWKREGQALSAADSYGKWGFWAPEVYCINGAFYMFFSAQSHVCVAVSDSPLGPFVQKEKKPMIEGEKCIDNTLFIDDDGRKYMYFDRFNDGLNIWMCELENDLLRIKPGTMQKCIHVSQEWDC